MPQLLKFVESRKKLFPNDVDSRAVGEGLWTKTLQCVAWGAAIVRAGDNAVLTCNRAFARMHKWNQRDLLGQSFTSVHAPDAQTALPSHLQRADQRRHYSYESVHVRKDGTRFLASTELVTIQTKGRPACRVAFVLDITQRKRSQERQERVLEDLKNELHSRTMTLRRLSGELLRTQDAEHRRIARELHDSVGQYLVALKIDLHKLGRQAPNSACPPENQSKDYLSECLRLVELCLAETRTLSHLLHPPLLDETGFISAAHWYIDGFSKRSGIQVQRELPESRIRLPRAIELVLFRTLQEALTNVYRHSGSKVASIHLGVTADSVVLKISDRGRGMDPAMLHKFEERGVGVGVGLSGIRERINELNGELDIRSCHRGTVLKVRMPLRPSVESPEHKVLRAAA